MLIINMTQAPQVLKDYFKSERLQKTARKCANEFWLKTTLVIVFRLLTEATPNQCMVESAKQFDPLKS